MRLTQVTKTKYELEAEIARLKEKRNKLTVPYLIALIVVLLVVPVEMFLGISYFVHWFSHDHMTLMQNFKWSLSTFWYLWVYIIAGNIFHFTKFVDMKFEYEETINNMVAIQSELRRRDKEEKK